MAGSSRAKPCRSGPHAVYTLNAATSPVPTVAAISSRRIDRSPKLGAMTSCRRTRAAPGAASASARARVSRFASHGRGASSGPEFGTSDSRRDRRVAGEEQVVEVGGAIDAAVRVGLDAAGGHEAADHVGDAAGVVAPRAVGNDVMGVDVEDEAARPGEGLLAGDDVLGLGHLVAAAGRRRGRRRGARRSGRRRWRRRSFAAAAGRQVERRQERRHARRWSGGSGAGRRRHARRRARRGRGRPAGRAGRGRSVPPVRTRRWMPVPAAAGSAAVGQAPARPGAATSPTGRA